MKTAYAHMQEMMRISIAMSKRMAQAKVST